jgi:DNA-binding NarL/FixJ family response regulator
VSSESHTVALVEDDSELRTAIVEIVEEGGWVVTEVFPNAESALPSFEERVPDVILMDIQLPGMSGIELAGKVRAWHEDAAVLMLTVYDDTDRVFSAIAAGASGYLLKRDVPTRLLESMDEVLTGGAPVSSDIALKMFEHFQKPAPDAAGDQWNLTTREQEIIDGLVKGDLYKEIADHLGISVPTVRFHLGNIYKKLHVRTRTEAVVKYLGK